MVLSIFAHSGMLIFKQLFDGGPIESLSIQDIQRYLRAAYQYAFFKTVDDSSVKAGVEKLICQNELYTLRAFIRRHYPDLFASFESGARRLSTLWDKNDKPFDVLNRIDIKITDLFLEPTFGAPFILQFERQQAGRTQVLYLIGGVHIACQNWAEQIPESLFIQSQCLAVEDINELPINGDSEQIVDLMRTFYKISMDNPAKLYSFEMELAKRYLEHHPEKKRLTGLEDRKSTFQYFEKKDTYSNTAFVSLLRGKNKDSVNFYRNIQMVENLSKLMTHSECAMAVVGQYHLPDMAELLSSPEYGFRLTTMIPLIDNDIENPSLDSSSRMRARI